MAFWLDIADVKALLPIHIVLKDLQQDCGKVPGKIRLWKGACQKADARHQFNRGK